MNTKKFFTGLTALALSIGLVLAGCEGPTGADGARGGGGAGKNGPSLFTGAASVAALEAALGYTDVVILDSVTLGAGYLEVASGKTLSVTGVLTLGDTVIEAPIGALDIARATSIAGSGALVVPAGEKRAAVDAKKGAGIATTILTELPDSLSAHSVIEELALTTANLAKVGSAYTLYVLRATAGSAAVEAGLDTSSAKLWIAGLEAEGESTGLTLGAATYVGKLTASGDLTVAGVSGGVEVLDLGGFDVDISGVGDGKINGIVSSGETASTLTVAADGAAVTIPPINVGALGLTLDGGATQLDVDFDAWTVGTVTLPGTVAKLGLNGTGTVAGTVAASGDVVIRDGSYVTVAALSSITVDSILELAPGIYHADGAVTIDGADGDIHAANSSGKGLYVGTDQDNAAFIGSDGAAASVTTPVGTVRLSSAGILVYGGSGTLTAKGAGTAGARIEVRGTSTITVADAETVSGATDAIVITNTALISGAAAHSSEDVVLTGDTGVIVINYNSQGGKIEVSNGGAIDTKGGGKITSAGSVEVGTTGSAGSIGFASTTGVLTILAKSSATDITVPTTGNLTVGAATTIDLKGDGSTVGSLILTGHASTGGQLTLAATTSKVINGE
jgi:hypothetical protein